MMAVVSICSLNSYKDQVHPVKVTTQIERGMTGCSPSLEKAVKCFSPLISDHGRRCIVLHHGSELLSQAKKRRIVDTFCMVNSRFITFQNSREVPPLKFYSTNSHDSSNSGSVYQRSKTCSESSKLEMDSCRRQLETLDSYFGKLHDEMDDQLSSFLSTGKFETVPLTEESQVESPSQLESKMTEMADSIDQYIKPTGLGSLEKYFSKLNTGSDIENSTSPSCDEEDSKRNPDMENSTSPSCDEEDSKRNPERVPKSIIGEYQCEQNIMAESNNYEHLESTDNESSPMQFGDENIQGLSTYDNDSDFYIVSLLAAIDIAVFLFEIASPIRSSDVEHLSLPLIFGGKINKLILVGEWWRLLTPMFLHSGFLHVALSCWVLLSFGPQVCRGYGAFTFFLIYALGGISGNLTSFIHTPELTVCGTGPEFAIIGAWLVCQVQNKEVIPKEVSESMFWKAVIATVLSFVLSYFGRIDDWTHLGATLSGIIFGYLTCPTLELDDAGQREGIALVQRQTTPCKSLVTFTLAVLILSFLVFMLGCQEILQLDGLV